MLSVWSDIRILISPDIVRDDQDAPLACFLIISDIRLKVESLRLSAGTYLIIKFRSDMTVSMV